MLPSATTIPGRIEILPEVSPQEADASRPLELIRADYIRTSNIPWT